MQPKLCSVVRSLILLVIFPSLVCAFTTFKSNCSIPTDSTNFVSSSDTRGTMDILWSCLFTIITCTYTVQHLNVPEQREGRNPGFWGDIRWSIKRGWKSAKWMFITVIAPEILLAKNVGDLTALELDLEKLQDWAAQDGVPWTRTHSLFANMGGFVIRRSSPARAVPVTFPETATDAQEPIPRARTTADWKESLRRRMGWKSRSNIENVSHEANRLHHMENKEPSSAELGLPASTSSQPVLIHLLSQHVVLLRSKGLLPRLPYIIEEEINDKSKSDSLVRVITIVQITWMVIQIIVRAYRSLAISQLEISVIAFATCAVIIYGLNWEKPKGVQVPITIIAYPGPFPEETIQLAAGDKNGADVSLLDLVWYIFEGLFTRFASGAQRWGNWALGKPIPNNYNRDVPWENGIVRAIGFGHFSKSDVYGLLLGTTVFGAVHIAAWNFVFPTSIESLLWKIAAVLCTTMALALGSFIILLLWLQERPLDRLGPLMRCIGGTIEEGLVGLCLVIIPLTYVLCRLFLVVEIFRSLCFLPPSAYIATWATNVPHVA